MRCYEISISKLKEFYKNKQIELEPPYQRKPAWKTKQRLLLLSSLFNGIPIPAFIFHKHFNLKSKKDIYDVLDGKQRIETILHFIELIKLKGEDKLWVEFINPRNNKKDYLSYDELSSRKVNKEYENILEKFFQYPLPVIEYEGELLDFFGGNVSTKEVFVRINSTGSPLKKHEIRHAIWSGPFFELGNNLERKYSKLFVKKWQVASKADVDRYLLHEFLLELCTAIKIGSYSDRRKKLDELLSQHRWTRKETSYVVRRFNQAINWIKDIFPKDSIRHTRFKNKSDFYSVFVVLNKLIDRGYVTLDKKSNRTTGQFLLEFSKQIQKLDPKIKAYDVHGKLSKQERRLLSYIISTRQSTDSMRNREIRDSYLLSVLKDGFILKTKDSRRSFAPSVKDLLWSELMQRNNKPRCPNPIHNKKCKRFLTYEDAQIDHKHPWSKGGKSTLKNAQLICSSCNSSKGNR